MEYKPTSDGKGVWAKAPNGMRLVVKESPESNCYWWCLYDGSWQVASGFENDEPAARDAVEDAYRDETGQ